MVRLICFLIGYAFGLVQTSYLIGRKRGIDIRKAGSGNAGSTNALRTMGLASGLTTLAVDVGKALFAVLFTWALFHTRHAEMVPLLKIVTGAGVIIGHIFPFYLGFRGGKGVAAYGGMIIAFLDPPLIWIGVLCLVLIYLATHYVSLAALAMVTEFFVGVTIFCVRGKYGMAAGPRAELICIVAVLSALVFFAHRENIRRLLSGKERKTYFGASKRGAQNR